MNRLIVPQPIYDALQESLQIWSGVEAAAVLFTAPARIGTNAGERYLARELWIPAETDYLARGADRVSLQGEYILHALVHAQKERLGVVFVHTHPMQTLPQFSTIDDGMEQRLADLFAARAPTRTHLALVVGRNASQCRILGAATEVPVVVVGSRVQQISWSSRCAEEDIQESRYDRQVRAIGKNGQQALGRLRVAIVGLGGTGSLVAQQLAYLGFKRFLLIDPQALDETNTNRVVGCTPEDAGSDKIAIASRLIRLIQPDADIDILKNDVCDLSIVAQLRGIDVVMSCTDSHGSRAVLSRLAYQYVIPVVDLGALVTIKPSGDAAIFGRVQLLAPGQACLHCHQVLDGELVRLDLLSHEARARDPYGMPPEVIQPAVISFNGVVASLAVTMLLQVFTPLTGEVRALRYDGVAGRVKEVAAARHPRCPDCAARYAYQGDNEPQLARAAE